MTGKSDLEFALLFQMKAARLPVPEQQWGFDALRKWRFDFAFPGQHLGVEVDGGTWIGGRHTSGRGFEQDCEKLNRAAVLGWTVLRFTGAMVEDGRALDTIEEALQQKEPGLAHTQTRPAIHQPERKNTDGDSNPTRKPRQPNATSGR